MCIVAGLISVGGAACCSSEGVAVASCEVSEAVVWLGELLGTSALGEKQNINI